MCSTQVVKVDPDDPNPESVRTGAEILRCGGVVAFPTETVYGVAVRADLPEAVERLRRAKQRPDRKPFTVHVGRRGDAERFVSRMSGIGRRFVSKGWPGPLTLVFTEVEPADAPVMAGLPEEAAEQLYHEGTIGLRCPDHAVAAALLRDVEAPVVAASANLHDRPPARTGDEALAAMQGLADLVIDAGPSRYAQASTVVRLNGQGYEILRQGVYDERTVRRLAMLNILLVCTGNTCRSPMAAALMRKQLAKIMGIEIDELEDRGIVVGSAGTFGGGGAPASPEAVSVMRDYGLDISGHASRGISPELIQRADRILTMTESHRQSVIALAPDAADRCSRIDKEGDIQDPIGGPAEVYAACARRIESSLRPHVDEVLA